MGLIYTTQFVLVALVAIATMMITCSYLELAGITTKAIKSKGLMIFSNFLAIVILIGIMIVFFKYCLGI